MAATADRNTPIMGAGGVPTTNYYPVAASTTIYKGTMVCLDASGNLVSASDSASLSAVVGTAIEHGDNSAGAAADIKVNVCQGVARWANGNSITKASVGLDCYVSDNQTVATSGTSHSVIAGTIYLVDANGVWVYLGLEAPSDASALTTFEAALAATSHGEGASLVAVEDASSVFTGADVEACLTECMTHTRSVISCPIPAYSAIADAGVLLRLTPGFIGRILGMHVQATTAVTTGSKLTTLTPKIAGGAVTGGVVSMTSAGQNAIGAVQNGTAVTAANTFTAAQEITVVASSTTTFVEGAGVIYLVLG